MGFDKKWFNELRTIAAPTISTVAATGIVGNYPNVGELYAARAISISFLDETLDLVRRLNGGRFSMSTFFKTTSQCAQHIYNYPKGRAYRMQWNIGFYAGPNLDDDSARIGIGFSINKNQNQAGIDDYTDFIRKIQSNINGFTRTFSSLGSYSEPMLSEHGTDLMPEIIRGASNISLDHDWRFYGKLLRCSSENDRTILNSVQNFADEAVNVFTAIKNAGFGY